MGMTFPELRGGERSVAGYLWFLAPVMRAINDGDKEKVENA